MQFIAPVLFFLIGVALGSFGSVVVVRTKEGESFGGRSRRRSCKKILSAVELIPVLSWLMQHGKCRKCKKSISALYPLLELSSGLLFLLAWIILQVPLAAFLLGVSFWLLLVIATIDFHMHAIPDFLSGALILTAIALSVTIGQSPLPGMFLGGGFFTLLWVIGRGQWVGSGDILLSLGIGALLGDWELMAACLFITYIFGALIASILLLSNVVRRGQYVAFAPFLALGTLITVLLAPRIGVALQVYFAGLHF